jgi:hypothetical protein
LTFSYTFPPLYLYFVYALSRAVLPALLKTSF